MLLGTKRYQVGSDGCSPHRMLLGTERYQVGSDGCSLHRMLLGTERYQVGSDGNGKTNVSHVSDKRTMRTARLYEKHTMFLHTMLLERTDVSRIFQKNTLSYPKTHYVLASSGIAAHI